MSLSKPLPTLSQMPWNVKQDIVNCTDTLTKFSVRGCSKECKSLVDSSRIEYYIIELLFHPDEESISVKLALPLKTNFERNIKFAVHPKGFSKQTSHKNVMFRRRVVESKNQNYIDAAVSKLCSVMGKPNVRIRIFRIHTQNYDDVEQYQSIMQSALGKLQSFLGSMRHRLKVRSFHINFLGTQELILKVLPYIEPGYLRILSILRRGPNRGQHDNEIYFSEVCELEQWKRANYLSISSKFTLPKEKWTCIPHTHLYIIHFSLAALKEFIQVYSNSATFKSASFSFSTGLYKIEVEQCLSQYEKLPCDEWTVRRKVPIPNSTDHIRIRVSQGHLKFQKHSNLGCGPVCKNDEDCEKDRKRMEQSDDDNGIVSDAETNGESDDESDNGSDNGSDNESDHDESGSDNESNDKESEPEADVE